MGMITFAKPRHEYHSYRDFWALVELSGFPVVYIDEMDIHDSEMTYIFTGPEAKHEFKGATARIIYWLLEWYADYEQRDGVAETWVSNRTFADRIGARFVVCGSHAGLGTLDKLPLAYEVTHMSYDGIHRRNRLLSIMRDMGIVISPNGWDEERDRILRSSLMMLHIHQNGESPAIAPLRASLAAAYGLPFIAENGWSIEPFEGAILHGNYENLPTIINNAKRNAQVIQLGKELHRLLCDQYKFGDVVRGGV
jgi:hypothetical protein